MTESLFQQIWAGLYFQTSGLQTTCGKDVAIVHQGDLNLGDGPDFKNAEIRINGLPLKGDIELHLNAADWVRHGHHKDSRYHKVILHVVLSGQYKRDARATLPDGGQIPCLVLKPHISTKLNDVLGYTQSKQEMACSGMLHLISPEIVERQIDKAHQFYFEYRVEHLMKFYDPNLPPSKAWQKMFGKGLFDGLGVNRNSSPMVKLCSLLYKQLKGSEPLEYFQETAIGLSGLNGIYPGAMNKNSWDFSASRPANQPKARIEQAATLLYSLYQIPPRVWLTSNIREPWVKLVKGCQGIGEQKKAILFATIYLPSMHILGNLFHFKELMKVSYSTWMSGNVHLPESILRIYDKNGFPDGKYRRRLGAVYQYKHLCRNLCCTSCFVMQKLLQA
ncbi:MAG: DUF2851 family protein [Balneolales bacterium]